uniref:CSON013441 protein n=1 Tax=Culicoides sonorensis TaxID=179676 RepID=A0A336M817_CULSO
MKTPIFIYITILCVACQIIYGAPNNRLKRDVSDQQDEEISPIYTEDETAEGSIREKRKLVEPVLQSKNAILGFVFGKLNSLIDSKTKFIDTLDRQNIEKNKQHNIETPKPIGNFQDLISGVITPKITAITGKIGSLSGSFLGSSSGGAGSDSDSSGSGGGLGNIVSSLLRLSGPLLAGGSGSSASANSGASSNSLSSDEDDDFN